MGAATGLLAGSPLYLSEPMNLGYLLQYVCIGVIYPPLPHLPNTVGLLHHFEV